MRDLNMEVDIKKIQTYVISLKDAIDRKKHMINVLTSLEIENWSFFDAVDVRNKFPYWIGCGLSHYMVLQEAKYPCMVLEDDVAPTSWIEKIYNIPENSLVYFGLSSWGLKNGQSEHLGVDFLPYDKDVCQIKYMTSGHAIYYPSKEVAKNYYVGIVRQLFEVNKPFDEHYAIMQTKYNTYGLKKPLFYQHCPNNMQYTYFKVN